MSEQRGRVQPPPGPHFERRIPEGDSIERYVCGQCGHVHYANPRIVVGSVVTDGNRILLCRRAIEPRKGLWTLPAGYLEENETPEDGARREAREEAGADIEIDALLAVYSLAHISQVQLMYRARLQGACYSAGPESFEVRLFEWSEIPRDLLAFPSVHWALDHFDASRSRTGFAPFTNPPGLTGSRF